MDLHYVVLAARSLDWEVIPEEVGRLRMGPYLDDVGKGSGETMTNQELDRLLIPGTPNVEIKPLSCFCHFIGSCLICWAIKGKWGQGFVGEYSSIGRAVAALKLHFAATHDLDVVTK